MNKILSNDNNQAFSENKLTNNSVIEKIVLGFAKPTNVYTSIGSTTSYVISGNEVFDYTQHLIHDSQQIQYHHNDSINSAHWIALHYNNLQGVIL